LTLETADLHGQTHVYRNRTAYLALLLVTAVAATPAAPQSDPSWKQWGGPSRDFIVEGPPLADSWPADGPVVLWSRPLGTGHSTILVDGGMLFTMYRVGSATRSGPWSEEETVVALDAATGETLWEHTYPSRNENFQYGAGPHSTPLIVGDRLFSIGTNKQFYALDKRTGEVLWHHDLIAEFGAPPLQLRPTVTAGYGCSPIAYEETVICTVGGPGQSVMAFNQSDGSVVWRGGDFLFGQAPPALINVDGQDQLVIVGGASINGMDPGTGEVLWAVGHDPGNEIAFEQTLVVVFDANHIDLVDDLADDLHQEIGMVLADRLGVLAIETQKLLAVAMLGQADEPCFRGRRAIFGLHHAGAIHADRVQQLRQAQPRDIIAHQSAAIDLGPQSAKVGGDAARPADTLLLIDRPQNRDRRFRTDALGIAI